MTPNETKYIRLTNSWLQERHSYWSQKLVELNIFQKELNNVLFEIKYHVKSYNGMFRIRNGVSKIIIYPPNTGEVNQQFVDNVLVHEMIHQYIHENKLHDSSSHGAIFRKYMNAINYANIGVTINISTNSQKFVNTNICSYETHKILVLKFSRTFFLCKVKSTKVDYFTELILNHKIQWKEPLVGFGWYKTTNAMFNNYQTCVSKLHGAVYLNDEWNAMFEKLKLTKFEVISEL